MRTDGRHERRRGPALADEGGMMLVLTMVILLVVSTLAATNLINAFLERSLAQNTNNASVALNAADGGINAGLAWVNTPANLTLIEDDPAPTPRWRYPGNWWSRAGDPATRDLVADPFDDTERDGTVRYTVTVGFKVDTEDQDCDGFTDDVVVFNRGGLTAACPHDGLFGFPTAIFTGAPGDVGYPVLTINAKGYIGTLAANRGYRELEMDIARNKLAAQVEGAFTARAGVSATGSSMTDGRNYDLNGNLVVGGTGCMADKPGITYDSGVTPTETCPNANIVGSPCVASHNPTAPGKAPLQKTPWGVLGLNEADFRSMFEERAGNQLLMTECYPATQYVWFSGDYTENSSDVQYNSASPCSNYAGILVVHNANFDPDQWEARCPAGSTDAYCSVDADGDGNRDNAPAVFNMNGNVQWTGIVIADQVVRVNGNPVIRGGIITLASGGIIDATITGNITIQYSCDAVTGASNLGYKTRLGWHRVH